MVDKSNRRLARKPRSHLRDSNVTASGVLTRPDIEARLRKPVTDAKSLVVTPWPREIDRDSLDLRLGCHFFIPRSHRTPYFLPGLSQPGLPYSEEYIPFGSYLVLPAHHTVLGATLEYIKLPSDVSGEILTKSSWARTFITIETAPWVHPLYRGCLTLEIANASNTPVVLYSGVHIAQLILLKTTADTTVRGRDQIEGTYIGPVRPEPAQLKGPRDALRHLGVREDEIVYPFDEYLIHSECREHVKRLLQQQELEGGNVETPEGT